MSAEMIHEVIATWETPYSSAVWKDLDEKKTRKTETQGTANVLRFGPVLHDAEDDRVANLAVRLQMENEEPRALRWHLHLRQPPKSEAPEAIKADDAALGGRPGLMTLVQRYVPNVPPVVSLEVTMYIPNEYRCTLLPDKPVGREGQHAMAASLAQTTRMEQIGYRFEDSPYGLEEVAIVYGHHQNMFKVAVRGRSLLRIGKTRWLPPADEVCDIVLNAFFERRTGS